MEALRSSETLVTIYQSTPRNMAEDLKLHQHRYEELKSRIDACPVHSFALLNNVHSST
jgi:hypothetical protein